MLPWAVWVGVVTLILMKGLLSVWSQSISFLRQRKLGCRHDVQKPTRVLFVAHMLCWVRAALPSLRALPCIVALLVLLVASVQQYLEVSAKDWILLSVDLPEDQPMKAQITPLVPALYLFFPLSNESSCAAVSLPWHNGTALDMLREKAMSLLSVRRPSYVSGTWPVHMPFCTDCLSMHENSGAAGLSWCSCCLLLPANRRKGRP